jgi:NAD(P)-dependent dehydrogenase (short-subunit alcohol dehydrogenase family)
VLTIDLSGRSALVSGSTGGIGFAIARGLALAGAQVTVNGREQRSVDAALARLRAELPTAHLRGIAADLGGAAGCATLVARLPAVDILVNNLGIFGPQDFFATSDDTWERFFETNVLSGVRLSRAYVPGMVSRGWGRVMFLSSESALNIPADMIHYGVTKTADLALSRGLAKRLAGTGVTVNAILPGPTLSDGVRTMLAPEAQRTGRSVEEMATQFVVTQRPSSILRRPATVEEVANLVVYVASPLSSATTGAALRVDGGVVDTIA